MKVKVFESNWNISIVEQNKDKLFVYADNYMRIGRKGQAIIRGLENTVGLATKKAPNKRDVAYLNDKEIEENKKRIDQDILNIKYRSLKENKIIVLSHTCYGNGLALMPEKCPLTYEYLNKSLLFNFNFDNLTGKKIKKIPGYDEVKNAKYIHISKENTDIISGINNTFFIKEYLEDGLISTYDLILSGKKIAFTHKSSLIFNPTDILILKFDNITNYLVVRVSQSYHVDKMPKEQWSMFEGLETNFEFANNNYIQTHFEYICILDSNNNMILPGDLFANLKEESIDTVEEKEKEESIDNSVEEKEKEESIDNSVEEKEKEEKESIVEEKEESIEQSIEETMIEKKEDSKLKQDDLVKIEGKVIETKTKEDIIIELLTDIKKELSTKKSFWEKIFGK